MSALGQKRTFCDAGVMSALPPRKRTCAVQLGMSALCRVRAKRARGELKWRPKARSLIEEIERGCYAQAR
jgi:hypothetical protein